MNAGTALEPLAVYDCHDGSYFGMRTDQKIQFDKWANDLVGGEIHRAPMSTWPARSTRRTLCVQDRVVVCELDTAADHRSGT